MNIALMVIVAFLASILIGLIFYNLSIHRKIIVKNNFLTDANGNTYSFSDFTGVKVLNKVSIHNFSYLLLYIMI